MKLYTEEQIKEAYLEGWNDGQNDNIGYIDRFVDSLTPIELPEDDEDAGKVALYISSVRDVKEAVFFVAGAMKYNEWIKSKILLNQNK